MFFRFSAWMRQLARLNLEIYKRTNYFPKKAKKKASPRSPERMMGLSFKVRQFFMSLLQYRRSIVALLILGGLLLFLSFADCF